jgi:hypothetical protein
MLARKEQFCRENANGEDASFKLKAVKAIRRFKW